MKWETKSGAIAQGAVRVKAAPIRKKFVEARRKREEERPPEVFVLKRTYDYSEQYEEFDGSAAQSAVQPFRFPMTYNGRDSEVAFIAYLEQQTDKIGWKAHGTCRRGGSAALRAGCFGCFSGVRQFVPVAYAPVVTKVGFVLVTAALVALYRRAR